MDEARRRHRSNINPLPTDSVQSTVEEIAEEVIANLRPPPSSGTRRLIRELVNSGFASWRCRVADTVIQGG